MADLTNIRIDTNKLRKAREKRELTQSEVAKAVGVQKAAISKIECGGALPSAHVLGRLCKLYEMQIADLMSRSVS